MIYYGEEVGLAGGPDPANRGAMVWHTSAWNATRLALVRRLGALRRSEPALRGGRYLPLPQPGTDVVAFARVTTRPSETLLFVANAAAVPRRVRLFVPLPSLYDAVPLADLLGDGELRVEQGTVAVDLPAHGVALYRPRDDHPSGYRFWK
jgi:glycosidase